MNYEQRWKLQQKLSIFSDAEIDELKSVVIDKEQDERRMKKEQARLKELYD